MSLLSHGQEIVLRHHLADYPEDATFQDIMNMLEDCSDQVSIWFPFEDWHNLSLIEHLSKLANNIDKVIVESHKEE